MRRRIRDDLLTLLVIFGLLAAVYLLPPDTTLAEIEEDGILRACVPTQYPPLVTGDPQAPGLDIALLEEIAERMGIRLVLNTNTAMGRDFNPRNWRVTRAQCNVLAGGVVASELTRSFLDTTRPHLETGWAVIRAGDAAGGVNLEGASVGVYTGLSGLDRIALSRFLRDRGVRPEVVETADALAEGLRSGRFDAGISEALVARQIAGTNGWQAQWLSGELERLPVAFGLWKGDLTLKRRLAEVLDELAREGVFDALAQRYGIAPMESA